MVVGGFRSFHVLVTTRHSFMTERVAEHSDDGTKVDLKSMFTVAEMFVFFL